jgi:hypothetical protein
MTQSPAMPTNFQRSDIDALCERSATESPRQAMYHATPARPGPRETTGRWRAAHWQESSSVHFDPNGAPPGSATTAMSRYSLEISSQVSL